MGNGFNVIPITIEVINVNYRHRGILCFINSVSQKTKKIKYIRIIPISVHICTNKTQTTAALFLKKWQAF